MAKLKKMIVTNHDSAFIILDNGHTYQTLDNSKTSNCDNIWLPNIPSSSDAFEGAIIEVKAGQVFISDEDGYYSISEARDLCQSTGECEVNHIAEVEALILGWDYQVSGDKLVATYKGCSEELQII